MSLLRSSIFALRARSGVVVGRQTRHESSTKDIQDGQHSGSRSAPRPTAETGTSTQAPNDKPGSTPPSQKEKLPENHQQKGPEQEDGEPGTSSYMAHTEDKLGGELKSNSPFRAAPLDKKVGKKTIAPDLEANERSPKQ